MASSAPWWGTSITALLGFFFTVLSFFLGKRTERRRLSRDEKIAVYPRLAEAGRTLANMRVWPSDSERLDQAWDALAELAEQVTFLGSRRVNGAVDNLWSATKNHRCLITEIRRESKPGHRDAIERRFESKYSTSVTNVRNSVEDFVRASRKELEIRGKYRPIESAWPRTGGSSP